MHNSVLPQFDNLAARMPESKFNIVAETTSLAPDHGDGKFFKFQDKSSSSDSGLFSLSPLNLLNTRAHLPISVQRRRAYKSRYDNIPACAVLDDVSPRSRAVHHFRLPLRSMAAARNVARDDHAVTMPHARCYHRTPIPHRECVFICVPLLGLYPGPCMLAIRPSLSCASSRLCIHLHATTQSVCGALHACSTAYRRALSWTTCLQGRARSTTSAYRCAQWQ